MSSIMDIINIPVGWVLKLFSDLCGGHFALAVLLLTVFANLIVLPLTMKSQRSSAGQARLRPRMDAIKKRCGDDKKKYNEEVQKLYSDEGVSMAGGCLPMLLRLPFFIGVYNAIRNPLTYVLGMSSAINAAKSAIQTAAGMTDKAAAAMTEFNILERLGEIEGTSPELCAQIRSGISSIDFNLFGIKLTETPSFGINIFEAFQPIWLIPILSFVASIVMAVINNRMQKNINPDSPNMGCIMYGMPVWMLVLTFTVPGAVGFYWACSQIVSGIIQIVLQKYYGPNRIIAGEQVKNVLKRNELEKKKMERIPE